MTKNITVQTTVNRPAEARVLMSPSAALALIHPTTLHVPCKLPRLYECVYTKMSLNDDAGKCNCGPMVVCQGAASSTVC